MTPLWRTTDFGYLRLHEGRAQPRPRYGRRALRSWLDRVTGSFDDTTTYVFLNNDPGGAAVVDAAALTGAARRRGVPVGRVPATVGAAVRAGSA